MQNNWDVCADQLEEDPMRVLRYALCQNYLGNIPRDAKILEVGCGQGDGLNYLHTQGFSKLYGVEVSEKRLERSKQKCPSEIKFSKIEPDAPLPFQDASFDAVISLAVIEHTLNRNLFLHEINRVGKPNAKIIISSDCYAWRILQFFHKYKSVQPIDQTLSIRQYYSLFKSCGLNIKKCRTFCLPSRGSVLLYFFFPNILMRIFSHFGVYRITRPTEKEIEKILSKRAPSFFANAFRDFFHEENIFLLEKHKPEN